MSDEVGDRIDGEENFAAPDWHVRSGPATDTEGKRRARRNTRTVR